MTKLPPLNSWFHLFTSKTVGLHDNMIVKGRNVGERKIFSHFKRKWKKWNGKCKLWFQWNSTKNIHLQKLSTWGFWLLRIDIFNTITRGSLRVSYRLRYVSVQCPDSFEWCNFILLMTFYIFFRKFQVLLIKCVFPQLWTLTNNTLHS